jgi:hypothetical protein
MAGVAIETNDVFDIEDALENALRENPQRQKCLGNYPAFISIDR